MNAEIISIGSELLLGQIVDTNASWIAQRLANNGINLIKTYLLLVNQIKEVNILI